MNRLAGAVCTAALLAVLPGLAFAGPSLPVGLNFSTGSPPPAITAARLALGYATAVREPVARPAMRLAVLRIPTGASAFDRSALAGLQFHLLPVVGAAAGAAAARVHRVPAGAVLSFTDRDAEVFSSAPLGDLSSTVSLSAGPTPRVTPMDAAMRGGAKPVFAPGFAQDAAQVPALPTPTVALEPVTQPNAAGLRAELTAPMQIGNAHLRNDFGAVHLQDVANNPAAAAAHASDDQLSAGTSLDLRAFGRPVTLGLSGSLEHLSRNDPTSSNYVPFDPTSQPLDSTKIFAAPGSLGPAAFAPSYVDVTTHTIGAAAALAIRHNITLKLQYNSQDLSGNYALPGAPIDARKDLYLGNITYAIPRSSSAITFSAKQYHFYDNLVPTNNLTQNRADLNLTVKF